MSCITRRYTFTIFLLMAFVIVIIAVVNLVWNFLEPYWTGNIRLRPAFAPIQEVIPGSYSSNNDCPDDGASLTIRINQLQPSNGTIAAILEFQFSQELRAKIHEYNEIAAQSDDLPYYTMLFEIYDGTGHETKTELISRFRDPQLGGICDADFVLQYDLPLIAASQRFPDDWYYYKAYFDLSSYTDSSLAPVINSFTQQVQADTGMSPYVVTAGGGTLPNGVVEISIARSALSLLYVYGIAISPLLLYFTSFYTMQFSKSTSGNKSSQDEGISAGTKLVLELAITLIAVVSLRQVFVPQDIQGLTRIDYLLGVELAVAMFWSIYYATKLRLGSNIH